MVGYDFLTRLSREMRIPMEAILSFAQLLEMREDDPEIRESSEAVMAAGRRLRSLIDGAAEFSTIEAGQLKLSLEPLMLADVVNHAVDIAQPIAKRAQISLIDKSADFGARYVVGDRERLVQVLISVLTNAIQFNRAEGSVEVSCEVGPDKMHRILVRDTGIGIPADCA